MFKYISNALLTCYGGHFKANFLGYAPLHYFHSDLFFLFFWYYVWPCSNQYYWWSVNTTLLILKLKFPMVNGIKGSFISKIKANDASMTFTVKYFIQTIKLFHTNSIPYCCSNWIVIDHYILGEQVFMISYSIASSQFTNWTLPAINILFNQRCFPNSNITY